MTKNATQLKVQEYYALIVEMVYVKTGKASAAAVRTANKGGNEVWITKKFF